MSGSHPHVPVPWFGALAVLALVVLPLRAHGQDGGARDPAAAPTSRARIEGDEWVYWAHAAGAERRARACAPPCSLRLPRGAIEIEMAVPGSREPEHRRTVELTAASTICVRRWSHEGERIAGGFVLVLGLSTAVAVGAAIGSAHCGSTFCEGGGLEIIGVGSGLGIAAFMLAVGLPLVFWNDEPTVEVVADRPLARYVRTDGDDSGGEDDAVRVSSERPGALRLGPGPGEVGVGLSLSM